MLGQAELMPQKDEEIMVVVFWLMEPPISVKVSCVQIKVGVGKANEVAG